MAKSATTTTSTKNVEQQSARSILDRAKKLNMTAKEYAKELHSVFCDALSHADQHKNVTIITSCFNLIHAVTSKRGVQMWVQRYTNLRWRNNPKTKSEMFLKPKSEALQINMKEAKANPFWNMPEVIAAQRPVPAIDIDGRIISLIKLCETRREQGKIKGSKEEQEKQIAHLERLKALVTTEFGVPAEALQPDVTETNPIDGTEEDTSHPETTTEQDDESRQAA